MVVFEVEPVEAGESTDFGWESGELVVFEVEPVEAGESADLGW